MVDLVAKSPLRHALPLTIGKLTLTEDVFDNVTSVALFSGREQDVSSAFEAQFGISFPKPGQSGEKDGVRISWCGRGQAMVFGPKPASALGAAITDQTDAWAYVTIEGTGVREALARLVPIDLRPGQFLEGDTARTLIGHMNGQITRTGPDQYALMVFRSMAGTLLHDLTEAMETVAAQSG